MTDERVYRLHASFILGGHVQLILELVSDGGLFVLNPALGFVLNGPHAPASIVALLSDAQVRRSQRYTKSLTRSAGELERFYGVPARVAPQSELLL